VNVNNGNTEDYVIVERNTSWEIFVINGVIKQQNVEIATYKTETEAAAGKIFKIVKIYNVNNQLVAQLKFENFEKEVSIITLKDNKKYNVSSKTNFEGDKIKESMQLLIEYLYI
jgi:ethanolamine utilization microcompartment shell protein EutL